MLCLTPEDKVVEFSARELLAGCTRLLSLYGQDVGLTAEEQAALVGTLWRAASCLKPATPGAREAARYGDSSRDPLLSVHRALLDYLRVRLIPHVLVGQTSCPPSFEEVVPDASPERSHVVQAIEKYDLVRGIDATARRVCHDDP